MTNIYTIRDNLKNTIAGKEKLLKEYLEDLCLAQLPEDAAVEFLKVNLAELRRILADVEVCAKQASDDSWITNPDRQGGGGWTADELDPNRGWK
jgi:hypothetical protein